MGHLAGCHLREERGEGKGAFPAFDRVQLPCHLHPQRAQPRPKVSLLCPMTAVFK